MTAEKRTLAPIIGCKSEKEKYGTLCGNCTAMPLSKACNKARKVINAKVLR